MRTHQRDARPSMAEDYYDVLGVSRTASDDEINRAYRDLARKHHPDLNPDDAAAKKKFQDVTAAFEVLSDKKKREQYDRFGPAFEKMQGGAGAAGGWPGGGGGAGGQQFEFDLGDLFGGGSPGGGGGFADLFKQFGGGGAPPRGRTRADAAPAGEDIHHEITVPFRTAVSGGEAALSLQRAGGKSETLTVKIPAGVEDGQKIRLRGQGNPSPAGGAQGDLLLTIRVAEHPSFRRRGDRLDVAVPVTLAEAAAGAKIDVPTPKGVITLTVPPGTSSGAKLRVKGHGVERAGQSAGDLFAEIQVALPSDLTDDECAALAEISDRRSQTPRADLRW